MALLMNNSVNFEAGIVNYKTSNIALFSLLQISKTDCAVLYTAVDAADGAKEFSLQHCGKYWQTFLYLWTKYKSASLLQSKDPVSIPGNRSGTPLVSQSYQQFFSFVLFFMSVDKNELIQWLFWLVFVSQKILPDQNLLAALVDELWGQEDEDKFKRKKYRSEVEFLLKNTELDELCPAKMRVVDIRSGGAWSRPLFALRQLLTKTTGGKSCWKRMSTAVQRISRDMDGSYSRMHFHHDLSVWGNTDPVISGERRAARKGVRSFLRHYRQYLHMPLDNDNIEDLQAHDPHSGWLEKLSGLFWESGVKNYAGVDNSNKKSLEKKHSFSTPLEITYAEALTSPMQQLYSESREAQDKARRSLRECDEAIVMDSKDLILFRSAAIAGLHEQAPPRRSVVVDVSSSSDESNKNGSNSDNEEDFDDDND